MLTTLDYIVKSTDIWRSISVLYNILGYNVSSLCFYNRNKVINAVYK